MKKTMCSAGEGEERRSDEAAILAAKDETQVARMADKCTQTHTKTRTETPTQT